MFVATAFFAAALHLDLGYHLYTEYIVGLSWMGSRLPVWLACVISQPNSLFQQRSGRPSSAFLESFFRHHESHADGDGSVFEELGDKGTLKQMEFDLLF